MFPMGHPVASFLATVVHLDEMASHSALSSLSSPRSLTDHARQPSEQPEWRTAGGAGDDGLDIGGAEEEGEVNFIAAPPPSLPPSLPPRQRLRIASFPGMKQPRQHTACFKKCVSAEAEKSAGIFFQFIEMHENT